MVREERGGNGGLPVADGAVVGTQLTRHDNAISISLQQAAHPGQKPGILE
jgi:hypothetical protein